MVRLIPWSHVAFDVLELNAQGRPQLPAAQGAFDPDKQSLDVMKEHYRRGGLGDTVVKSRLLEVLLSILDPIRARRHEFAKDPGEVMRILKDGTTAAREVAAKTIQEVRGSVGIDYFPN